MFMKKAVFLLLVLSIFIALQGQTEMLGPLTREAILKGVPEWQQVMASYQPDPLALDELKAISLPVQVEVFLGTWCPDSKAHLSEFFKVLDLVDNPLLSATYIGLPRDKAKRAEYCQGKDIQKIPTFIMTVEGQEKGRIIEAPLKSIEQDLVNLLLR
jgi:hypothetical protein